MNDSCFIPKYPGGVEGSLIVGLTPFQQVLEDTFIVIEEPEPRYSGNFAVRWCGVSL
jgi:hypothetical protein